ADRHADGQTRRQQGASARRFEFLRAGRPLRLGGVRPPADPALLARSVPEPLRERSAVSVLITGGCGYVGTKLTEAGVARPGHHVTGLGTQWFGNHLAPDRRLTVLKQDVRAIDDLNLSRYDTVFHLANIANDPSVELNPYASWEVNVLATMRLVDRAARHGVRQIVFASSSSV